MTQDKEMKNDYYFVMFPLNTFKWQIFNFLFFYSYKYTVDYMYKDILYIYIYDGTLNEKNDSIKLPVTRSLKDE